MRAIGSPAPNGSIRTAQPPSLQLVDAHVSPHVSIAPSSRATAPSEARAERDDPELGPQLWYALFLSTFLVGLLVLGGFWIWFNVPVL